MNEIILTENYLNTIKTKKFTNLKNNPVNLNQTGVDHTLKQ